MGFFVKKFTLSPPRVSAMHLLLRLFQVEEYTSETVVSETGMPLRAKTSSI